MAKTAVVARDDGVRFAIYERQEEQG